MYGARFRELGFVKRLLTRHGHFYSSVFVGCSKKIKIITKNNKQRQKQFLDVSSVTVKTEESEFPEILSHFSKQLQPQPQLLVVGCVWGWMLVGYIFNRVKFVRCKNNSLFTSSHRLPTLWRGCRSLLFKLSVETAYLLCFQLLIICSSYISISSYMLR